MCQRPPALWKPCLMAQPPDYEIAITGIDKIEYVVCQCGFMFMPKVIADEAGYYQSTYRKTLHNGTEEVSEEVKNIEKDRGKRLVSEILKRANTVERAMDVGSSTGYLLSKIGDFYDCLIQGVEPNTEYRKYSISQGIPTAEKIDQVNGIFDLITCIHTLEHTIDPVGFLKPILEHANQSTLFLIEVPFYGYRLHHPVLYTFLALDMVFNLVGLQMTEYVLGDDITVFARKR
jgi:hypothetical protein